MNKLDQIKALSENYDSGVNHQDIWDRFNALVQKHGHEAVSAASGLKMVTVIQYQRKAYIGKISVDKLVRAETILNQL